MTDIKEARGLEVVAWQDAENPLYVTGEKRQMHGWATDGYPIRELMTVAQHQRILAQRDKKLRPIVREICESYRGTDYGKAAEVIGDRIIEALEVKDE